MITTKLTGNTRYRVQPRLWKTPLLVLQVELNDSGYCVDDSYGSGRNIDYTYWVDASVEHLGVFNSKLFNIERGDV